MKRILYLLFVILAANVWGRTLSVKESENPYPEIMEMDSLIVVNDTAAIRCISENIAKMDREMRKHSLETAYVHSAIDNLNAYAVKIFSDSEIGFYHSKVDSITPFDYLYDENLENRFLKNKDKKIGDMSYREHFVAIHYMLMIFQPIDFLMLMKAEKRLESIDDDLLK